MGCHSQVAFETGGFCFTMESSETGVITLRVLEPQLFTKKLQECFHELFPPTSAETHALLQRVNPNLHEAADCFKQSDLCCH